MSELGAQRPGRQAAGAVSALVDDRLYALSLPYRLDGPTSTHPAGATGYSATNCYVLRHGSRALLVDTGYPAQEEELFDLLGGIVEPGAHLSVMPLRAGEANSLGNLVPLAHRYRVDAVYCMLPAELLWDFDVRPLAARPPADGAWELPDSVVLQDGVNPLALGADGARALKWFRPLLHMILQTWLYDEDTRTMFTSEVFGHVTRDRPDGPWIVDDVAQDPTTAEELASFLRGSPRFWWLPGADGRRIADWLEDILDTCDIQRIAAGFGCVFEGRGVVAHQFDLLRRAVLALAEEAPYTVKGSR